MILTADWHLTDQPQEEYRWEVFSILRETEQHAERGQLYILGDLSDRKDRHSSVLVNRVADELVGLLGSFERITILIGNHDMPLVGPPFWLFLNEIDGITVVTQPQADGKLLLLPHSHDLVSDWKGIPFHLYDAVFMHQTVTGVLNREGFPLEGDKLPVFPKGIKIYSGDIHEPQFINGVTYVGAPHPKRFGDSHKCRMLRLHPNFKIAEEIKLNPIRKLMIDIADIAELKDITTHRGDQARIRLTVPIKNADTWPASQDAIAAWAEQREILIASVEAIVESAISSNQKDTQAFEHDPTKILNLFAKAEGISGGMLEYGHNLLKGTL